MSSISIFSSFGRFDPLILLATSALLLLGFNVPASAQTDNISGGPITRQVVPTLQPRDLSSPLDQQDLSLRPIDDQKPVSSFLKNVQGESSAIEVILGRGKLITLQSPLAVNENKTAVVAAGDPTVFDFDILPNAQMIRILGKRVGATDLSVVTENGEAHSFEIRVVYDLNVLRAYVKQLFPSSDISIVQMSEHLVVEGQAASTEQSFQIIQTIENFAQSAQVARKVTSSGVRVNLSDQPRRSSPEGKDDEEPDSRLGFDQKPDVSATVPAARIINLIRVPGIQQVMLEVKVAEVNRNALRRLGSSVLYGDASGRTFGSTMGSSTPAVGENNNLLGLALGQSATSFALIPNTSLTAAMDFLRANQVISVLAEPNLMAMHGQKASFLAGGEFPITVPQQSGGGNTTFTIQFKEFGVLLDFVPYIMDDGAIRLKVAPEVSTIDQSIGVVSSGVSVPGFNTRRANTTVEMREGQTLALAGLLQVELDAGTNRLPGLGDLPYLGSFFSNASHERVEKELVILVTPHLVDPMAPHEVGPLPGQEIRDPDDHEFYALNRIEARHPTNNYRATNGWDDPLKIRDKKNGKSKKGLFRFLGFSK